MKKKIILTLSLFLPTLLYLSLVFFGKNVVGNVGYIGPKEINATNNKDTVYHTIENISFVDMVNDSSFRLDRWKDKILIMQFFSSQNADYERVNTILREFVHERFKQYQDVELVSIVTNPKVDTPTKMKEYAERLRVDKNCWHFIQIDSLALTDFCKNSLFTNITDSKDFNSSILIDRDMHTRGKYNNNDINKVKKELIEDLKALIYGYNMALKKNNSKPKLR